jgi:Uma2 family endonuclease
MIDFKGTDNVSARDFLVNGDHLDQSTFHAVYESMPEHCRAELIGGVVYMASPMRVPHGKMNPLVSAWLGEYEAATPGTEVLQGATAILGPISEPEPDHCLRLLPEYGGSSRTSADDYLEGPPELIVEISHSTAAIDLHQKKDDYEAAGVKEYLVLAMKTKQALWFQRRRGKFARLGPDADGIFRSRVFPGLWLDPKAIFAFDRARTLAVARRGLASPEHAAFRLHLHGR